MKARLILLFAVGLVTITAFGQTKLTAPVKKYRPLDVAEEAITSGDMAAATAAFAYARVEALGLLREPPDLPTNAYIALFYSMMFADKLRDAGKKDEARALYQDLLGDFKNFKSFAPEWNPNLVKMRIGIIEQEIERLK